MRKSIVIIILGIYIASIVIVGYLGLQPEYYDVKIYVDRIEVINPDVRIENGRQVIRKSFYGQGYNYEDDSFYYRLEWRAYPDNASQKGVKFSYDRSIEGYTVSANGTVKIPKPNTYIITIVSNDGRNVSTEIELQIRSS